jgi:hypothetical protein
MPSRDVDDDTKYAYDCKYPSVPQKQHTDSVVCRSELLPIQQALAGPSAAILSSFCIVVRRSAPVVSANCDKLLSNWSGAVAVGVVTAALLWLVGGSQTLMKHMSDLDVCGKRLCS